MSVTQRVRDLSLEEYLEGEQRSEVRHEYVTGQVYAMVGASRAHNTISLNLARRCVRIYATVRARLSWPT
jgi:Uma2 family endonuclease